MSAFERQVSLLASCGIKVPAWRLAHTLAEAQAAGRSLSFPLVVKAAPELVMHKTELGLVHLNLREPSELEQAFQDVHSKLPGAAVLVQEMVQEVVEVLLAMRHDSDFGAIAAIGGGGVLVELLEDVTYLPLPASPGEFLAALRELRVWRLLSGYRGREPRDVEALVTAASKLGDAYLASQPTIGELEINPLAVLATGGGVAALDILELSRPEGRGI